MLQILVGPKEELPGVEFHEDASVGAALPRWQICFWWLDQFNPSDSSIVYSRFV